MDLDHSIRLVTDFETRMNLEQPAPLPALAPSDSKRKPSYLSKTCKYAGVTFRE